MCIAAFGWKFGPQLRFFVLASFVPTLAVIQFLAHGMTRPLREMAAASHRFAEGDYSARVVARSNDEVGELATAFNHMADRVEASDLHRRELIAMVSHELRTPLAAVRVRLENVIDGIEPADPTSFDSMLRSVDRLGRLVEQLLDLSRLEAGTLPMHRDAFSLAEVANDAANEVSPGNVAITIDVPDNVIVNGDPERVQQVLVNLLANASRHATSKVELVGRTLDRSVEISVTDDGAGFNPRDRHAAFDRTGSGPGLGLKIARWIVDLHGGSIGVVDDHRSRVVVQLPAAELPAA